MPQKLVLRFLLLVVAFLAAVAIGLDGASTARAAGAGAPTEITGTGSSAAYPVIVAWASDYTKVSGVTVNYQSIGSGGGIKQLESKTTTFGVGAAIPEDEARAVGFVQWPLIATGIVPVVNLPSLGKSQLRLDGSILAAIYLSKIQKWNDAAIVALNPHVSLPDIDILPVHRSDGSDATLAFSAYLAKASPEWRLRVGTNRAIAWPTGAGAKGDQGVAATVIQSLGAIGYVQYAIAKDNGLIVAAIPNQDGNFVEPDAGSFSACMNAFGQAGGPSPQDLALGRGKAWPICAVDFVFLSAVADDAAVTGAALHFFDWTMSEGSATAARMQFGVVPADVAVGIKKIWQQRVRTAQGDPVYP